MSAEGKECLKPVLNKDRTLWVKEISYLKYIFGENLPESMEEAKESFRISNVLSTTLLSSLKKLVILVRL